MNRLIALIVTIALVAWAPTLSLASEKGFEKEFLQLRENYARLESSTSTTRAHRDRWERVIESFQSFSDLHPTHRRAAESRYLAAQATEAMYRISRLKSDAATAVQEYAQIASDYPGNRFAGDALVNAARLSESPLGDQGAAYGLYAQLVDAFPKHPEAAAARSRLKSLAAFAPPRADVLESPPAAAPQSSLVKVVETKGTTAGTLTRIRSWSNPGYTRIVLDISQSTRYSVNLLAADEQTGAPRRLYIDLPETAPAGGLPDSSIVNDGLLRQIRTGRPVPGKTRVVLDLVSFGGYKIFTLPDPYRIVIDITGTATASASVTQAPAVAPQPQPLAPAALLPQGAVAVSVPVVAPPPALPSPSAPSVVARPAEVTPSPQPVVGGKETPSVAAAPPKPVVASQKESSDRIEAIIAATPPEPEPKAPLPLVPKVRRKIVLDAGHGGKDPGAVGRSGLYEKDVTLAMAKLLAAEIASSELGWEPILTREDDVFIPLEERTAIANKVGADLFLSIHVNASPNRSVQGIETYYLNFSKNEKAAAVAARENGTSLQQVGDLEQILFDLMAHSKIEESSRLANDIQSSLVDSMGRHYGQVRDLGVKQGPFYVLLGANMPSVLVETAFISNSTEEGRLANQKYHKRAAGAILDGLRSYAGSMKLVAKQ